MSIDMFTALYPDAQLQAGMLEILARIQAAQREEQDEARMCRLLNAEEYLRQAWHAIEGD